MSIRVAQILVESDVVESLSLSGYKPYTEVLAQRSPRGGGRKTYLISLPLYLIGTYLPIPDPERPFPGNRRVNKRHAEKFGDYWRENEDWVTPPVLVDTTVALHEDWVPKFNAERVEFGILRLHQNSASSFDILDGQHRILGWKIAGERIAEELKSLRSKLQQARELEDEAAIDHWESRIEDLYKLQRRFESEYVTVEILQGLSDEGHKQAFNDIANNALGITKSVTVSFDRRSMINRIALDMESAVPLLHGRVDWEKDRVIGNNENFISGRNLADVVRHVALGINGRMTRRRESDMNESQISRITEQFFQILIESFPSLESISENDKTVAEVRSEEMITSATVLRILAGTFHNIAVDTRDERFPRVDNEKLARVRDLFEQLNAQMTYPLNPRWYETGFFSEGAKTPQSRAQDLLGLTNLMTRWSENGGIFS